MPRSRGLELPQRQSPRLRKSTSSDSEQCLLHHRPNTNRSPKLVGDRRSPRSGGSHTDPLNQKKLGTRIADLESQLGQAQDELRVLKEQLATAEAAKKQAQAELEKKVEKSNPLNPLEASTAVVKKKGENGSQDEVPCGTQQETDVFEVPVEKLTVESLVEPEVEPTQIKNLEEKKAKGVAFSNKQAEKLSFDDLGVKEEEINTLKAKLYDREKEREMLSEENESLKNQLNDSTLNMSNAKAKEDEMTSKLIQKGKELEESKANVYLLKEKLEVVKEAKEALEAEMKKLRVQTEQWRKAADAAAAVLADGVEMNGRISERYGSMDKHFVGGCFDPTAGNGGYMAFAGSPGMMPDDSDDGFGSGKKKGSGIKMFGDLWRKKGQK